MFLGFYIEPSCVWGWKVDGWARLGPCTWGRAWWDGPVIMHDLGWPAPPCPGPAFSSAWMELGPNIIPPTGLVVLSPLELVSHSETFLSVETVTPTVTPAPDALQRSRPAPSYWKTLWGMARQATPSNSLSFSFVFSLSSSFSPSKEWIIYPISTYN